MWGANLNGCQAEISSCNLGDAPHPHVLPNNLFVGLTMIKCVLVFDTAFLADAVCHHITGVKEPTLGFADGVTKLATTWWKQWPSLN